MRVSVFGNCQAAPIRRYMSVFGGLETPDTPLNYAVKREDWESVSSDFSKSDYVFAQRVSDDFGVEWARSSFLRRAFPGKVVVWPSVYFDGYYPDIKYLYYGQMGKVIGPLSDYHFDTFLKGYHQGMSVEALALRYRSKEILEVFPSPFERALTSLRSREEECDVGISEYIEANCREQNLFFTPNHPSPDVLKYLASILCSFVNLPYNTQPGDFGAALDYVNIPAYPSISRFYKLKESDSVFSGVGVQILGDKLKNTEKRRYELEELISSYFDVYKATFR